MPDLINPDRGNFVKKGSYTRAELLECAHGGWGQMPKLPAPPFLMFDRIVEINATGGAHGKGLIRAELDVRDDLPFFGAHFVGDPVTPGCLQLDAGWQLLGCFLGHQGALGKGRATGLVFPKNWKELKELPDPVSFTGQILPDAKLVSFTVELTSKRIAAISIGIGNGVVECDGAVVCRMNGLRVNILPQ